MRALLLTLVISGAAAAAVAPRPTNVLAELRFTSYGPTLPGHGQSGIRLYRDGRIRQFGAAQDATTGALGTLSKSAMAQLRGDVDAMSNCGDRCDGRPASPCPPIDAGHCIPTLHQIEPRRGRCADGGASKLTVWQTNGRAIVVKTTETCGPVKVLENGFGQRIAAVMDGLAALTR